MSSSPSYGVVLARGSFKKARGEYSNIFERPEQEDQEGEGFDDSVDMEAWNEYQKNLNQHVYGFARRSYFEAE